MTVKRIGIDLAKRVFEVCGVDEREQVVLRKTLRRGKVLEFFAQLPPCLMGMEACGSAHYWARELGRLGHEVRLMAPQFVAPYRKNDKNDANDAEAICEAVGRPSMRFVPVKSEQQQAVLALHRARELLVRQRTALANHVRGLLAEFGIVVSGKGPARVCSALPGILEDGENGLPGLMREVLSDAYRRLGELDREVKAYDRKVARLARDDEVACRLMEVEGVGPLTATAVVASVGDPRMFKNGRQFAAWLGLVPRQHSSGGRSRQGRITKRGDVYLRTLLVHGARAVIRRLEKRDDARGWWVKPLLERRGFNKTTVALAAKNARILWVLMARGEHYQRGHVAPSFTEATAA